MDQGIVLHQKSIIFDVCIQDKNQISNVVQDKPGDSGECDHLIPEQSDHQISEQTDHLISVQIDHLLRTWKRDSIVAIIFTLLRTNAKQK